MRRCILDHHVRDGSGCSLGAGLVCMEKISSVKNGFFYIEHAICSKFPLDLCTNSVKE